MLLAVASIIFLTWESVAHHDWEAAKTRSNCKTAPVDKNDDGYKLMQKILV